MADKNKVTVSMVGDSGKEVGGLYALGK